MGAHRRRILRQRGARKRHAKSPDTTSLEGDPADCGDDGSSLGSSCWEEPAPRRHSRGTLIRHHPVPCSSSHGADNDNRRMVPPYHPGAACAEMIGYAGRLSSSHEVRVIAPQYPKDNKITTHKSAAIQCSTAVSPFSDCCAYFLISPVVFISARACQ